LGRVGLCLPVWRVGSGFLGLDRVFWLWVGSARASLFDVSGRVFSGRVRFLGFGSGSARASLFGVLVGIFGVGSGFLALGRVGPCLPV
jgi:hypothetical protein